jgi:hypothetical protein
MSCVDPIDNRITAMNNLEDTKIGDTVPGFIGDILRAPVRAAVEERRMGLHITNDTNVPTPVMQTVQTRTELPHSAHDDRQDPVQTKHATCPVLLHCKKKHDVDPLFC